MVLTDAIRPPELPGLLLFACRLTDPATLLAASKLVALDWLLIDPALLVVLLPAVRLPALLPEVLLVGSLRPAASTASAMPASAGQQQTYT